MAAVFEPFPPLTAPGVSLASRLASRPSDSIASGAASSPSWGSDTVPTAVDWALAQLDGARDSLRGILHPLGFLCLSLKRSPSIGICVHIWIEDVPNADLSTSPIHSHSWDLHSHVLFGRIGNARVETESVPLERASHRVYQIESAQGADQITATSQYVRCARVETQYAAAGEEYRLSGGEFHTTVVAEGLPAATVLVARTVVSSHDRSLGPLALPGGAVSRTIHRRVADAALSRKAVDAVLDRIPAPRSSARPGEDHAAVAH